WVQRVVADGHAICILPERSAAAPGLVTRPIEGLSLERELAIATVSRSTTPVEIRKIAQLAARYEWQRGPSQQCPAAMETILAAHWKTPSRAAMSEDDACTLRANSTALGSQTKYWRLIMQYGKSQEAIDRLTAEQRRVTQEAGTETPFTGEYNDHTEPGIYVDIISGEPLFASSDKFESGYGCPSFTKPIVSANINELRDTSHAMIRTEVRSTHGDSHLGHVFPDGPADRGGLRYCINSASLRFIHRDDMESEG